MDCNVQQAMEGGGTEQTDELEISQGTCPTGSPCGTTEEHWVDTIVRSKFSSICTNKAFPAKYRLYTHA